MLQARRTYLRFSTALPTPIVASFMCIFQCQHEARSSQQLIIIICSKDADIISVIDVPNNFHKNPTLLDRGDFLQRRLITMCTAFIKKN